MNIDMTKILYSIKDSDEPLEEFEQYSNPNFVSTEETPKERLKHTRKVIINLRQACLYGLLGYFDDDKVVSGIEKNKWGILAERIQTNDVVDLTSEEITLIKKRIGLAYGSEVVTPAYKLIDPIKESENKDKS